MFESLLISAGIPIITDFLKSTGSALGRKWIGLSVEDEIKLGQADSERIKALAELDNPYGTPSQWVVDLRASFRYIFSGALVLVGAFFAVLGAYKDLPDIDLINFGLQLASAPVGFILGERLVLTLKGTAR